MKKSFLVIIMLSSVIGISANAVEKIYYPRPESATDIRTLYPIKLLELALKKSETQYELLPSKLLMPQNRALLQLKENDIDIVWSVTTKEREQQLLPIRIPLYKGLIGWRLILVSKQNSEQFKLIKTVADMNTIDAGQGYGWPDAEILRANGLTVNSSSSYDGLFKMLLSGRFDYLPRSIVEIWPEAENYAKEGIVIDRYVVLHYPSAIYFFVYKNNQKLADVINSGLENAISDGSFDQLFHQYHDPVIRRLDLKDRTIIELNNPLLPLETPLSRKELWFMPKQ